MKKMKKNIIEFSPIEQFYGHILDAPQPAIKMIPEWYRTMKPYIQDGNNTPRHNSCDNKDLPNVTIKRCMPFFDAITSGYIATASSDTLWVDKEKHNGFDVVWDVSYDVISMHDKSQIPNVPAPYKDFKVYKWIFPFTIKTPPGYSCLFTHPKMRNDLPFTTIDGIVDTDKYGININFPFFMDSNFRGIIPKGTPICQIIPFRREEWEMKIGETVNDKKFYENFNVLKSMMQKSYKKNFWEMKKYK